VTLSDGSTFAVPEYSVNSFYGPRLELKHLVEGVIAASICVGSIAKVAFGPPPAAGSWTDCESCAFSTAVCACCAVASPRNVRDIYIGFIE
jgi:hypothetical protein